MIEWIDNADYESLLSKNRFAPAGDLFFQGEVGKHFMKVMGEKKAADPAGAVQASKNIGW